MDIQKKIALVACEARRRELLFWIRQNAHKLSLHKLYVYGFSSHVILEDSGLLPKQIGRGGKGRDQHLIDLIIDGELDMMIAFVDPLSASPCDVDIDAVIQMAVLYNLAIAANRATADFLISSTLFEQTYKPMVKEYSEYVRHSLQHVKEEYRPSIETNNFFIIT